jgi:hypothetical protein
MWTRIQRLFKHRWLDDKSSQKAMSPELRARLAQHIQGSEQLHRGEIRIYTEAGLPSSYLWQADSIQHVTRQRAVNMFSKLRVWDTDENNGVLIYLLLAERTIEIVADRGLSRFVSQAEWQAIIGNMRQPFQTGEFETGLVQAIDAVSALLEQHFPLASGQTNPNELPNEVMLG